MISISGDVLGPEEIENYNNIAKKALEVKDFVTYNPATTILAEEVKDEQHTEDVLKNPEGK